MKLLIYLLRHSRRLLAGSLVAGAVSGFANTGLLALINATLTRQADRFTLLWAFLGLCLVTALARATSELLLAYVGEGTVLALRMRLSQRVLAVPLRQLEEIGPHRVLSTLTDDIPNISNVVRMLPIQTLSVSILVSALVYLGWLSWQALAIMLVLMALGMLSYQLPVLRAFRIVQRARELTDTLYRHFRALTEGAKELRLSRPRREAFLERDLLGTAEQVRAENIHSARIFTLAASWGQLLIFVVVGLLLFGLPSLTRTDAATLTGYTLTLLYLMTPLQNLMDALPHFNRASVALERVERLGLELAEGVGPEEAGAGSTSVAPRWRRLELAGVTHVFRREDQEGEFVLGPIDLCFKPGETVFIAGGNGSGKTTLAKLLTGLYVPDEGEIRLDGRPIGDSDRDDYRQLFSAVFFDFFLFQSLLGLEEDGLDARAADLLAQLQLAGKVRVEGGRLSSIDLSQGQRKRLALMAAFLEDRPIYLFDEWAADQDSRFKDIFYHELLPKLKESGKTSLVITHDDRYFRLADRVIKLEEGKVVANLAKRSVKAFAGLHGGTTYSIPHDLPTRRNSEPP